MPDSFFSSSKPRKRKRSTAGEDGPAFRNVKTKKPLRARPSSSVAHGQTRDSVKRQKRSSADKPTANGSREKIRRKRSDEELDSDHTNDEDAGGIDDLDLRPPSDDDEALNDGDEDKDETPAEKRLRLAKLYLQSVKDDLADTGYDAAEIDKELISSRLKHDVMEHAGKVHQFIADSYDFSKSPEHLLRTRGHRLAVTCAVASDDGKYLFTSGKEGSIIKWGLDSGKKIATFYKRRSGNSDNKVQGKPKAHGPSEVNGHTDEVLALAISSDGKYLASGGKDRRVGVWDVETGEWVKGFAGHRDTISALSFRKGTQQLFSGSFDRTLKLFDLSVMGYVETLFGHQDSVLDVDALRNETAVSVGGRDKTVRFWKVVEESQLLFRGGGKSKIRDLLEGGALEGLDDGAGEKGEDETAPERDVGAKAKSRRFIEGSIECVAMIDETTFVSGGDSGSICLWSIQRKKPIFSHALAHGFNDVHSETEGLIQTPRWVTAIASLRYSDVFASGSWGGDVRIWKLDPKLKSFSLAGNLPLPGIVNSLQLITPPRHVATKVSWPSRAVADADVDDEPPSESTAHDSAVKSRPPPFTSAPVWLIAGVGQEHRLGRWLKVKGNGAVNCAVVAAFHPRTP